MILHNKHFRDDIQAFRAHNSASKMHLRFCIFCSRKFHIYPVKTIDEGVEILIGVKAGVRLDDGTFEEETVNRRVDRRLSEMAEKLREFPEFVIERRRKE
jgi:predicted ATP-dependent protease